MGFVLHMPDHISIRHRHPHYFKQQHCCCHPPSSSLSPPQQPHPIPTIIVLAAYSAIAIPTSRTATSTATTTSSLVGTIALSHNIRTIGDVDHRHRRHTAAVDSTDMMTIVRLPTNIVNVTSKRPSSESAPPRFTAALSTTTAARNSGKILLPPLQAPSIATMKGWEGLLPV